MIVMKNNDFKSSKRILPSKKMLCTASLLISKEIEKYIQKKENQLVDKLQQAGFLSTKLTVRQADKLEEELTNILQSHNEEFISLLKKYQEQGKTLEDVLNALPNFNDYDLVFAGGGADQEQSILANDLIKYKENIKTAIENGVFFLLICGAYQLFGKYYKGVEICLNNNNV